MNILNILVAVDFSPASRFGVDLGVALARAFRAKLTLLHVLEDTSVLPHKFPSEWDKADKRRYDQALRLLSILLGPEDQDDLNLQIRIRRGKITNEIRASILDEHASLVIMGTHSRGFARRLLIGSVTRDLLRKLPVPAISISNDNHSIKFSRILFATDLSDASREAFNFALDISRQLASELIVFHSIEPVPLQYGVLVPGIDTDEGKKQLIEEARAKLASIEREGIRAGIKISTELADGPASETLLAAIDSLVVQLVIMPVQDRGVVERAILGATAERVIQEAKVPVLSFPAGVKRHSDDLEHRIVPDRG